MTMIVPTCFLKQLMILQDMKESSNTQLEMQKEEQQGDYSSENRYNISFPHSNDDPLQLTTMVKHRNATNPVQDSFSNRFPWLSFSSKQHHHQYIYQGRHTEKYHPFYIRFDLKKKIVNSIPHHQILDYLSKLTTHITLDFKNITKESIDSIVNQAPKEEGLQNINNISIAYLLTGIAKPTTTVNDVFDFFFETILEVAERYQEQDDEDFLQNQKKSKIETEKGKEKPDALLGYHRIINSWKRKLNSLEYFKFITRAYTFFRDEKKMEHQDILKELFFHSKARLIKLINIKTGQESSVSDYEFQLFFASLLKDHADTVSQAIRQFQNSSSKSPSLTIALPDLELNLKAIDFTLFAKSLFEKAQLPQQSLKQVAAFHRNKYSQILEKFTFKTKNERLVELENLKNEETKYYSKVQLISLTEENEQSRSAENTNYLVLHTQEDTTTSSEDKPATLAEVIEDSNRILEQMESEEGTVAEREFERMKNDLFEHILACKKARKSSSESKKRTGAAHILSLLSLNPKQILINSMQKKFYSDFDYAFQRALGLDKLPLTHQQSMLNMTPKQELDIYQMIYTLMEDLKPRQEIKNQWLHLSGSELNSLGKVFSIQEYLKLLCDVLSDKEMSFTLTTKKESNKSQQMNRQKIANPDQINKIFESNMVSIRSKSQLFRQHNNTQLETKDYQKIIEICFSDLDSTELFQLLLISMIEFEAKKHFKCLLSSELSDQKSNIQFREYFRWSKQQQKEAFQFGLLLLICSGVIKTIDYHPKTDKNEEAQLEPKDKKQIERTNNFDRVRLVIEEHFLKICRQYQYLRMNHNQPQNHFKQVLKKEYCFQIILELFGKLTHVFPAGILKAALLLCLLDQHLQFVLILSNLQDNMYEMQASRFQSSAFYQKSDQSQKSQKVKLQNLQLLYSNMKNKARILWNGPYKTIKITYQKLPESKKNQNKDRPSKSNIRSADQIMEDIDSKKKKIQNIFNENKPKEAHHEQKEKEHQQWIFKLREDIKLLQKKVENKAEKLLQDKEKEEIHELMHHILMEEEDNLALTLKEAVAKKRNQIRREKITLFCKLHNLRKSQGDIIRAENNAEKIQKEELNTLQLLAFFLYQSPSFNNAYLRKFEEHMEGEEVKYLLSKLSRLMMKEIKDLFPIEKED